MRIALIKPPPTYADWYKRPLLGISYISSVLKAHGHECRIFDAYFRKISMEELVREVVDYQPEVIGLTAMTHEIDNAAGIAKRIKNEIAVTSVIGGCHITALPVRTLEEYAVFDYGIYGEGEVTILELLTVLRGGKEPHDVDGLAYRQGDSVRITRPRQMLPGEELDQLPLYDLPEYYGNVKSALSGKREEYALLTSRGCPYSCAFCMQVLGKQVRRRSNESILREIESVIENYGAHTFSFIDDVFLFNTSETRRLLQAMIDRGISRKIKWGCLTRANLVNEELISLARKAGCRNIHIGVESGDDEILKAIGKSISVAQVEKAVRIIKRTRITLGAYFILGHPNETRESLQRTMNLAVKLNTDQIAVGVMVPYPGTEVYELAKAGQAGYKLLSEEWRRYDKYGGDVLAIEGLPQESLLKWQKRIYLNFYLRNFKVWKAFEFFWQKKRALWYFIGKARK